MRKLVSHLRDQWMGALSLFLVLAGGTAWAATELDKNEVKSKHIGKGQVKNADLGKNSVTSPKVADGSLLQDDFATGQLPTGPRGPQGLTGAPGAQGPPGDPGADGAQGPAGPTFAASDDGALPPEVERLGFQGTVVNMPAPGRLFLSVNIPRSARNSTGIQFTCSSAALGKVGMYVDGEPVEGTRRSMPENTPEEYNVTGLTAPLSAGLHDIQPGASCDGAANANGMSVSTEASIVAVLIGG